MSTHNFAVFVKKTSSGEVWEARPLSYSFTDELNRESVAKFTVSFEDLDKFVSPSSGTVLDALSGTFREIWIERDGSKIFWGAITDLEIGPNTDGDRTVTIKATSWFGLFGRRIAGIPKRAFTSTDAGSIAWTLIDESQDSDPDGGGGYYSDFGITQGSITTSVNRDRTYRFKNVRDAIVALSNENLDDGFDFDIDMTKNFNVYYPTKGSNRFNLTFDDRTIDDWRYGKPLLLSLANRVHVIGGGDNDDVTHVTRTAGTSYRDDWFTLDDVLDDRESLNTTLLNDKGDRLLAESQSPVPVFEFSHYDDQIEWSDYAVGDTIQINKPDLGFTDAQKRVTKRKFDMKSDKSIAYITSYTE